MKTSAFPIIASLFLATFSRANVAFPFPQNDTYDGNGIRSQQITPQQLQERFQNWRTRFVTDVGAFSYASDPGGVRLVTTDEIANGMLFFTYFSTSDSSYQKQFDALHAYYSRWKNKHGLMSWWIGGMSTVYGANSMSEGDIRAAAALILASRQFRTPAYLDSARNLLDSIRKYEIDSLYLVKSSDDWSEYSIANHFSPEFFRLFAAVDTARSTFWDSVRTRLDTLMLANRHPTTKLLSDRIAPDGTPYNSDQMGYEGIAVPFHQLLDFYWNHGSAAEIYLTGYHEWVLSHSAHIFNAEIVSYSTGVPHSSKTPLHAFTGAIAASFGCNPDTRAQERLNQMSSRVMDTLSLSIEHSSYQLLYGLLLSGNLPNLWTKKELPVSIQERIDVQKPRNKRGSFRIDGRHGKSGTTIHSLTPDYHQR